MDGRGVTPPAMWTSLLLWSTALAAMPPEVDLTRLDTWDGAAEQLLDGPPGCWEIVGKASWSWDLGRFGGSRGDAVFAGRLTDGTWSEVHLAPLGEVVRDRKGQELQVYAKEARFAPLVGKLAGRRITVATDEEKVEVDASEQAEASNVLRSTLERVSGQAITSWAEWDDLAGAVVLHRAVPIGDRARAPEAEVAASFPGGGSLANALDVVFPERFKDGRWPNRFTIRGAEAHLRGTVVAGMVFPASEAFQFEFGLLGWWGSGAQTIEYTQIKACPRGAPAAEAPAVQIDRG